MRRQSEKDKRKCYWTYVEKDGGRDEIRDDLAETIRSHYDRLERIADDVDRLGYKVAAKILSVIRRRKLTPRIIGYQRFIAPIGVEPARRITRIVFQGIPGYVPTAMVALTPGDAERLCDKLNRRLGLDREAWSAIVGRAMFGDGGKPTRVH